jgi:hypothetical protein
VQTRRRSSAKEGHADHAAQHRFTGDMPGKASDIGLVERYLIVVDRFNHRFLPRSKKPSVPGAGTDHLRISLSRLLTDYQSLSQHLPAGQRCVTNRRIIDDRPIESFVQSTRQASSAVEALQQL